jgi:predicted Na+-dependent transporter
MTNLLRFAGKNGAWVVISGVILGFCFPVLSATARPYLTIAIFLFTFGSFLKLDFAALREQLAETRATALMVLWATLGVPLVVFAIIMLFRPGPDLTQGLLFWSLVPTSPACVAFATILGLRPSLALLATVAATAASPFYMPWLAAALGGYQVTVNPASMSLQLLLIVGGAGLAATLVKRFAASFVRDGGQIYLPGADQSADRPPQHFGSDATRVRRAEPHLRRGEGLVAESWDREGVGENARHAGAFIRAVS